MSDQQAELRKLEAQLRDAEETGPEDLRDELLYKVRSLRAQIYGRKYPKYMAKAATRKFYRIERKSKEGIWKGWERYIAADTTEKNIRERVRQLNKSAEAFISGSKYRMQVIYA